MAEMRIGPPKTKDTDNPPPDSYSEGEHDEQDGDEIILRIILSQGGQGEQDGEGESEGEGEAEPCECPKCGNIHMPGNGEAESEADDDDPDAEDFLNLDVLLARARLAASMAVKHVQGGPAFVAGVSLLREVERWETVE